MVLFLASCKLASSSESRIDAPGCCGFKLSANAPVTGALGATEQILRENEPVAAALDAAEQNELLLDM